MNTLRSICTNDPRKSIMLDEVLEKNPKQDRMTPKHYQVCVLKERCKGCNFCIEFCPQKAISKSTEINSHGYHVVCLDDSDRCNGCNICAMICPEFAIIVTPIKEEAKKRR